MKAVNVTVVKESSDRNSRVVDVLIIADSAPAELPVNGASVDGLLETDTFAPFSILYVIGQADKKVYIANESGIFVAQ